MYRFSNHPPVVCLGTANAKSLTAGAAQWDRSFAVGSSHGFVVGDPVFIRNSASTLMQYLGRVVAAGASSITTEYPAVRAYAAGTNPYATVWRPVYWVRFLWGPAVGGTTSDRQDGVSQLSTRGGVLYSVKAADAIEEVEIDLGPMRSSIVAAWDVFRETRLSFGTASFTAAWWDPAGSQDETNLGDGAPRVAVVRLVGNGATVKSSGPGATMGTLKFRIVTDGSYL